MARLVLTAEEKAAISYIDWDDIAIGKFVKKLALTMKKLPDKDGFKKMTAATIAILLIGDCVECNADSMDLHFKSHTLAGIPTGDWDIKIKRKRAPNAE